MLEQLSDQVRECYERAAEAKARANATNDPVLKAAFLDAERRWLILARSFGVSETLEDFTAAHAARLQRFDQSHSVIRAAPKPVPASTEQILRSIIENSDDAIITKDLDGIISSWNASAERIFGYAAEEVIGKSITILIPPDREDEEPTILARLRQGERIDHYETVRQRKDGGLIDISLTVSPIKTADGKIIGAAKIARDVTERKRSEAHIATLAREAEHRTKNILATVQATVNLSKADTAGELKRAVEGRLHALANIHDLFVKSRWTGAAISTIATQELAPHRGEDEARVRIDGPHVFLEPNAAQAIAVTLHELATNSAKYGSLSVPKGQVEVTWSLAKGEQLILRWTESGGPTVQKPTRKGFGTSVVTRMIRQQSKGEIYLDWRPEGLA